MLFGCIIHYSSLYFAASPKLTDYTCILQKWFEYMGFSITFGALLVKTFRVDQVFKNMRKTKLNDLFILKFMFVPIQIVFLVFLTLWTIIDSPRVEFNIFDHELHEACSFDYFDYIGIGLVFIILIASSFLAFKVRNAPSAFNESSYIGFSVYNWFFITVIHVTLQFLLDHTSLVELVLFFIQVWIPTTIMLFLMFMPKFYLLMRKKGDDVATTVMKGTKQSHYDTVNKTALYDDETKETIKNLQNEVDTLIRENTNLKSTLMMCNTMPMQIMDDDDDMMDDMTMQSSASHMGKELDIHGNEDNYRYSSNNENEIVIPEYEEPSPYASQDIFQA
eukprot:Pgem_evm1s17720